MATDGSTGHGGGVGLSRREVIAVAALATALLIAVAVCGVSAPTDVSVTVSAAGAVSNAGGGIPVNTARAEELMLLPGIGAVRAAAIVAYRERNGPFSDIDSLASVPGIGPVTVDRIRSSATVDLP